MDNLSLSVPAGKSKGGLLKAMFSKKVEDYGLSGRDELERFFEAVKVAKQDLEAIEELFNNTCDQDLIEYAIYEEYAIKLRLSYLMKQAKEKNIKYADFTSF